MNLLIISFLCCATLASSKFENFLPRHGLTPLVKATQKDDDEGPVISAKIVQPLDHFDTNNEKTWNMRYMVNGQFHRFGGPIFIILGGEWTITKDFLLNGQMYDMARKNHAFMFYTEHRYYGDSYPTEDTSIPNLEYFNTDQALADVIHLIRTYKNEIGAMRDSKVVVFGGSYSGNMAIWLREKYPDDIFAAVSSSAPVYSKVEFKEYFEVMQTIMGPECSGIVNRAIDKILQILGTPEGALKIQQDFNTCKPINSNKVNEITYFIQTISTWFSNKIQYDSCGDFQNICNALIHEPIMNDYTKIATLMRQVMPSCIPSYPDSIEAGSNTAITPGENGRQWMYQVCYQIGCMQTTNSEDQPFKEAIPLSVYYSFCADIFDEKYTPLVAERGVRRTNMIYGGKKLNVTRVVSVHGLNDPWHVLGLSEDLNPLAPVILVPGASHTFDLASINACDNKEMVAAKLAVQNYINKWLNSA